MASFDLTLWIRLRPALNEEMKPVLHPFIYCGDFFTSFDSFNPLMLTLMYITIHSTVHSIGWKESKMVTLMYITIQSTVHSIGSKGSKDAHFDVYYSIQYSTFNRVKRVKRCSFWYTLWPHTVNGYNFLNIGLIPNCFTPLELSQSPVFISGFIYSLLLLRLKSWKKQVSCTAQYTHLGWKSWKILKYSQKWIEKIETIPMV